MAQFPEEQLDSPVGYFAARPGSTLGNDRWSVMRKLGWGPRSSTWLAVDSKDPENITAVKVFTVAATADSCASNELGMLRGPLNQPTLPFPSLQGHFYEQSPKGKHLCLILNVLGPSVESFRPRDGAYLPLHVVKKIVADIVEALCELQKNKVIHGAVNPDNFLFVSAQQAPDIRNVISASPTDQTETIIGSDGSVYHVIRSQPIEHGFKWSDSRVAFAEASICLSNFGYARFTHGPSISPVSAPGTIAAPEALQREKVDHKSDIWALGIATYLLLTGSPLFSASSLNDDYKETVANLEQLLVSSNKLSAVDIPSTVTFLKACLEIEPADRASADGLIGSDWVQNGLVCSCGWSARECAHSQEGRPLCPKEILTSDI